MKAFSAHAFQPPAFAKRKSLAGGRSYEPTQKQWCSWQVQAQALSHLASLLEDSMDAGLSSRKRIRPGTYLVHKEFGWPQQRRSKYGTSSRSRGALIRSLSCFWQVVAVQAGATKLRCWRLTSIGSASSNPPNTIA